MKAKILTIVLSVLICSGAYCQDLNPDVNKALQACLKMREGIMGSPTVLEEASKMLKDADTKYWSKLRRADTELSFDGHYIFSPEFADSLIDNRLVYKFAQRYAKREGKRGASATSNVYLRNSVIPARSTVTYTVTAKGTKSVAVVTEPGGLVTLKVKVKDGGTYKSKRNETKGEPYRCEIVPLSDDKRQTMYIEIKNTTDKDINVALIGN